MALSKMVSKTLRYSQWTLRRHLSSKALSLISGFSARHVRYFPSSSMTGTKLRTLTLRFPSSECCKQTKNIQAHFIFFADAMYDLIIKPTRKEYSVIYVSLASENHCCFWRNSAWNFYALILKLVLTETIGLWGGHLGSTCGISRKGNASYMRGSPVVTKLWVKPYNHLWKTMLQIRKTKIDNKVRDLQKRISGGKCN